jgi:glutathione S-transferase
MLVRELSLDVDLVTVEVRPPGMGGENHQPPFLKTNPNGKVPVLELGDFVLWESNAIMWFLCERHGDTPLWPLADPQARADIARWQLWQAAHLSPAADGLMYENLVLPMLGKEPDARHLASLTESFHRWCRVLDGALAKSEWLAQGRLTCADIAVASALSYARPARMPLDEHPRVVAWLARMEARPSWS